MNEPNGKIGEISLRVKDRDERYEKRPQRGSSGWSCVGEFYAQISKELAVPNFAFSCGRPPRLDESRKDRRRVPEG